MPTVNVPVSVFNAGLGKVLSLAELEELCFEFGMEVELQELEPKEPNKYSFETGSNRNDLLCAEGIIRSLAIFMGSRETPRFEGLKGTETIVVKKDTELIRPYVVGAILRDVKFTQESYESFIDLQDKLHQNICRKRTLVAIGTHDYDTIKGPFVYDARKPEDIKFVPLNKTESMDAAKLMEVYQQDLKLRAYLPIIRDSPVYPVIYDANGVVLSLPPIINGDHSKIKLETKNVFIECTATDLTKAKVTLNTVVAMFSQYCAKPFSFEEVVIHYEESNTSMVTPDSIVRAVPTTVDYVNKICGINLRAEEVCKLFQKMGLGAKKIDDQTIETQVPITRADILHECDLAEDIAIAYGYNNIQERIPQAFTVGSQQTINQMSDLIRAELAQAGYKETLNFVLCSQAEVTTELLKKPEEIPFVKTANPKTQEFQVGRTTLITGLLKSLAANKSNKLPMDLFEVGDVVFRFENEVGARNERRLAACHTDTESSGFELIHGTLDYLMLKLGIRNEKETGYYIKPSEDSTFMPGRQANVLFRGKNIGIFGVVHPQVLLNFEWPFPTSMIEVNLEPLIEGFFGN